MICVWNDKDNFLCKNLSPNGWIDFPNWYVALYRWAVNYNWLLVLLNSNFLCMWKYTSVRSTTMYATSCFIFLDIVKSAFIYRFKRQNCNNKYSIISPFKVLVLFIRKLSCSACLLSKKMKLHRLLTRNYLHWTYSVYMHTKISDINTVICAVNLQTYKILAVHVLCIKAKSTIA